MTPEQLLAGARVFALPLKREFRGVTVREGLLIEGPSGWGEFAPFPDHDTEHAARWLEAAMEQAFGTWPMPLRERVAVNAIIPIADPDTTQALVEDALASGCTTIKTKVGSIDFDHDVRRVAAIRTTLDDAGVTGAIRIDTNQRWSLAEAVERIAILDAVAGGLEYVEQPVAGTDDLRRLREQTGVAIAIDESVRLARDPEAALQSLQDVADVVVLKAIPLGGVRAALALAQRVDLPIVVSGSLDTSIGLASGLWLAAALPDAPRACGLATGALFQRDVVAAPQVIIDGTLAPRRVVPEECDPASLVDAAMRERWRARLHAAWQHARMPEATA